MTKPPPAARPPTRRECERRWRAAVRHWANAFGLTGQWHFDCPIVREEHDCDLTHGVNAYCAVDRTHGMATIPVSELVKPEYYPSTAAHEVLHVLFDPLDCAFEEIPQPGRKMLEQVEHRIIQRLALVLSGQGRWDGRARGHAPAWEASVVTRPPPKRPAGGAASVAAGPEGERA